MSAPVGYFPKKQSIAFSRRDVFGTKFMPNADHCFLMVSRMLFANAINPNGTFGMNNAANLRKDDVWSYIYYLYSYNNTILPVFKAMKSPIDGKANAVLFYKAVADFMDDHSNITPPPPIDVTTLMLFTNKIVTENTDTIVNPIFDYLKVLLDTKIIPTINGVEIVANTPDGKPIDTSGMFSLTPASNASNSRIDAKDLRLTNASKISNADIAVTLKLREISKKMEGLSPIQFSNSNSKKAEEKKTNWFGW